MLLSTHTLLLLSIIIIIIYRSGASTTMLAQMHVTTAVTRTPALIMVAWELHQCAAATLVGSADSPDH